MSSEEEIIFPYIKFPDTKLRPVADIQLDYLGNKQNILCIIDSGADFSFLPKSVGEALGIDFSEDDPVSNLPEGVDGKIKAKCFEHPIQVHIGKSGFSIRIFWVEGSVTPLLGREGIFDKFDILFQERLGRVVFVRKMILC